MTNLIEQVEILQNILISEATDGNENNEEYQNLRKLILDEQAIQKFAPKFLRTCRNLTQFWQFIKFEYSTYAERRDFLWKS